MGKAKKLLALTLGLVMCLSALAGCGDTNKGGDSAEEKTLVLSASGFENKFSPFFASCADDQDVADFTQLYMIILTV